MRSTLVVVIALALLATVAVGAQSRATQAPVSTARADAPIDLTGQWVAIISEDWRWRMITPPKGDIVSIPLNLQGQQAAEAWDPARDESAGEQCKAYGAPGLMRGPIRMRILLAGRQHAEARDRLRHADATPALCRGHTARTSKLAGIHVGAMDRARWRARRTPLRLIEDGHEQSPPRVGVRKNGVPYSERALFTEHWDVHALPNGDKYLVNTNVVDDPVYLQAPFQTAIHYKLERDTSKWDATPCDARF